MIIGMTCTVHADQTSDCMERISNNADFQKVLREEVFNNDTALNTEILKEKKSKILGAVAATVFIECPDMVHILAKQANGKIWTTVNNQLYGLTFKMADMFAYTNMRLGIWVSDNLSLSPSDVVEQSSIKGIYWSDECSDHTIWDNLDDDTAINIAGQRTFSQYGGSQNEYFLDFEEGNNRRAFPGLVLMDKTNSTSESIVTFTDLPTTIGIAEQFATALKGGTCSVPKKAVYVVNLDVQKLSSDGLGGWGYGVGVGGSVATVGFFAGLTKLGVITAGTKIAATFLTVPIYGWIAAGVLAVAGGLISLIPSEIENIERIMIMDGPYLIQ